MLKQQIRFMLIINKARQVECYVNSAVLTGYHAIATVSICYKPSAQPTFLCNIYAHV